MSKKTFIKNNVDRVEFCHSLTCCSCSTVYNSDPNEFDYEKEFLEYLYDYETWRDAESEMYTTEGFICGDCFTDKEMDWKEIK